MMQARPGHTGTTSVRCGMTCLECCWRRTNSKLCRVLNKHKKVHELQNAIAAQSSLSPKFAATAPGCLGHVWPRHSLASKRRQIVFLQRKLAGIGNEALGATEWLGNE